MKYFLSIGITIAIILCASFIFSSANEEQKNKIQGDFSKDVLRIHIRANSNSTQDQNIKFAIKDKMIEYISPLVQDVKSVETAKKIILTNKNNICKIIDILLSQSGFNYKSNIEIKQEFFPTRVYDGITFESGQYSAIIVELGLAEGNNWWCVMFPPLCFLNTEKLDSKQIEYRSKLFELFSK